MREISASQVQAYVEENVPAWGGEFQQGLRIVRNMLFDARLSRREIRRDMESAAAQWFEKKNLIGGVYKEVGVSGEFRMVVITPADDDGFVGYTRNWDNRDNTEEILTAQANASMLPAVIMEDWLTEDEETLFYRVAKIQKDIIEGTSDETEIDDTSDETEIDDTSDETEIDDTSDENEVTTSNVTGFENLSAFANSGKRGLANDPDEVEAINELQTFLVSLGLNVGRNGVDGKYGPATTAAVRQFQSEVIDLAQDGDAGPNTIAAIIEVHNDFQEIEELLEILNDNNVEEGTIPVFYKSSISVLLERELTQEERTRLEQLLNKYDGFIEAFPNYQQDTVTQARTVVDGEQGVDDVEQGDEQGVDDVEQGDEQGVDDVEQGDEVAGETEIPWNDVTVSRESEQRAVGEPRNIVLLQYPEGEEYIVVAPEYQLDNEINYRIGTEGDGFPESAVVGDALIDDIEAELERRGIQRPGSDEETVDDDKGWSIDEPNNRVNVTAPSGAEFVFVLDSLSVANRDPVKYKADLEEEQQGNTFLQINYAEPWVELLDAWIPLVDGVPTPEEIGEQESSFFGINNETEINRVPLAGDNNDLIQLELMGETVTVNSVYVSKISRQDTYMFFPVINGQVTTDQTKEKSLLEIESISQRLANVLRASFLINGDAVPLERATAQERLINPNYSGTFVENAKLWFRTSQSLQELERLLEYTREQMSSASQEDLQELYMQVLDFGRTFRGNETITFPGFINPRLEVNPNVDDPIQDLQNRQAQKDEVSRNINAFLQEVEDTRDGADTVDQGELRSRLTGYTPQEQNIIIAIWQEVDRNFGSDDNRILNAIQQIRTKEAYEKINRGYESLSSGRSIFIDLESTWTFSNMNALRDHLRRIGVITPGATVESEVLSLYKRMSKL